MGGRIYDPALGRFLSPDPNIPEPGNTQAFNRYAYVHNNPLSFTDPSGFVEQRIDDCNDGNNCTPFEPAVLDPGKGDDCLWDCPTRMPSWFANFVNGSQFRNIHEFGNRGSSGGFTGNLNGFMKSGLNLWIDVTNSGSAYTGLYIYYSFPIADNELMGAAIFDGTVWIFGAIGSLEVNAARATMGLPLLRQSYVDEVKALEEVGLGLRAAGADAETVARILHAERNALKEKYRQLSPSDTHKLFEQRNIDKYGNALGPSIDQLRAAGKTWDQIIDSAMRAGGKDLGF